MVRLSERQREIIRIVAWIVFVIVLVFLFITRIIGYLGPFLLALAISLLINRPVELLQKKTKVSRGKATAVVLFLFILIAGGGSGFLLYSLFYEAFALTERILRGQDLQLFLSDFFGRLRLLYANLPEGAAYVVEDAIASAAENVSIMARETLGYFINFALSLPRFIVFTVISLVATFFMVKDKDKISGFLSKQLPESWRIKLEIVAKEMVRTILVYIKAQAIVSSLNFILFLTGFSLLRLDYVVLFALFTTLFDALPVLGAGMVLGTSALIQLVMSDFTRGLGFIGIYLMVLMVRHSVEPKVIGKGVGLHPLVILLSMYAGLRLIGGVGLILGPIFVITLRALQKAGLLPAWKS